MSENCESGESINYRALILRKLLFLLVAASLVSLYFVSREVFAGLAQKQDSKIKIVTQSKYLKEPFEIKAIKNSAKSFKLNEEFEQETDWLKGFTIRLKNKADKNIKFISLSLDFPETVRSGNMMVFPMTFGKSRVDRRTDIIVKPVLPGKSVDISLTDKYYGQLKAFIESRHLLDELRQLQIRVITVLYEDDTGWSAGNLIRMEPDNPRPIIIQEPNELGVP